MLFSIEKRLHFTDFNENNSLINLDIVICIGH